MADDPRVRIGHCSPDAPNVDVLVDGEPAFEDLGLGEMTDYATLSTGRHDVAIQPAGGGEPVLETRLRLRGDKAYTALATGTLDDLEISTFTDDPGEVPPDVAHVRFIHASPDAPKVTVGVRDGPDVFERIRFRTASDFEAVEAGTYDLDVRPSREDEVVLSLEDTDLAGGSAYTIVAVGQVSEDTLEALVIEEEKVELAADD